MIGILDFKAESDSLSIDGKDCAKEVENFLRTFNKRTVLKDFRAQYFCLKRVPSDTPNSWKLKFPAHYLFAWLNNSSQSLNLRLELNKVLTALNGKAVILEMNSYEFSIQALLKGDTDGARKFSGHSRSI
jgi:hypothetical protein